MPDKHPFYRKDRLVQRRQHAHKALAAYLGDKNEKPTQEDKYDQIVDCITDLMHLAEMIKPSSKEHNTGEYMARVCLMHFRAETDNELAAAY